MKVWGKWSEERVLRHLREIWDPFPTRTKLPKTDGELRELMIARLKKKSRQLLNKERRREMR